MKKTLPVKALLGATLAAAACASTSFAATATWTGSSGVNFNWSEPGNWTGNTIPVASGTAVFGADGGTNLSPVMNSSIQLNTVYLNGSGYTLGSSGGSVLTVSGTASTASPLGILGTAAGTNTINSNIATVAQTVTGAGAVNYLTLSNSSNLNMNGNFTFNLNAATNNIQAFGFNIGAGSTLVMSGSLVTNNTGASTDLRFIKAGLGTLAISGSSNTSVAGMGLRITGGTVEVRSGGSLGSAVITIDSTANDKSIILANSGVVMNNALNYLNSTGSAVVTVGGSNTSGTVAFNSSVSLSYASAGAGDALLTRFTATSAGRVEFNGRIQNNGVGASRQGGIYKVGDGTVVLTGSNIYTMGTVVHEGTLLVNNTAGSGVGTGAVRVDSGGTLGGTGTLAPATDTNITINGTLSPGDSAASGGVGTLNFTLGGTGKLEFGATSVFSLQSGDTINFTSAGNWITVASGAVIDPLGAGWTAGVAYTIASGINVEPGTVWALSAAALSAGWVLDTSFGGNGFDVIGNNLQVQFAAVPEPSTIALAGLGLVVALRMVRRRKAD